MNRGGHILILALCLPAASTPAAEPAEELLRQRRLPEAEQAFEARLRETPGDAEAHHQLGRLAMGRRDFAAAIPHLEKAAGLRPENAAYHFHLGVAWLRQADTLGKTLRALSLARRGRTAMEKAVTLEPDRAEFREGLIEFYAQAPGIAGGGIDKARAQAETLRERNPRAGLIALAGVHQRAKEPGAAISLYAQWLAEAPDDYQVLYLAGRVTAESGLDLEHGIAALRRCLTLPPPPKGVSHAMVHYQLARALQRHGDIDDARASYRAALALEPGYSAAREALEAMP